MFENATTVQCQPGKLDAVMEILRTGIVPILKVQKGFNNLCLLPDRTRNLIIVMSSWQTKAHALAVEAVSAYRQKMSNLDLVLAQPAAYPMATARAQALSYGEWTFN